MQGNEPNTGAMCMQSMTAYLEHIANGTSIGVGLLQSIYNELDNLTIQSKATFADVANNMSEFYTSGKNKMYEYYDSISLNIKGIYEKVESMERFSSNRVVSNIPTKDLMSTAANMAASIATRGMYSGGEKNTVINEYYDSISLNIKGIYEKVESMERFSSNRVVSNIPTKDLMSTAANMAASIATRGMYNGGEKNTVINQIDNVDALLRAEIQSLNVTATTGTSWLESIAKNVSNILNYLPKLNKRKRRGEEDGDVTMKFNLDGLLEGIKSLKEDLTPELLKTFRGFIYTLKNFVNEDFTQLNFFGAILTSFSTALLLVGKNAGNVSTKFNSLTASILLMSVMLLSPMFILGSAVLVGVIYGITKAIQSNTETNFGFARLAKGIFVLSLSMMLMKFIPVASVLKTILLIGSLSLALKTFNGGGDSKFSLTRKGISSSSSGGVPGLVNFAVAITILTLSMFAMAAVPVMAILKTVGFIAVLGLTLKTFYSNNKAKTPALLSFALGITMLTISMLMLDDISWMAGIKLLSFIAGLGLVLKLFNFNKRRAGFTGFAFGMSLLVVSMYAISGIGWEGPIKLLAFIAGLGLVFKTFFSSKGVGSGFGKFAFGMAILVLSMYAMQDLPFEAMLKTLGFIAGLGLVLKLIPPTSGGTMLMLAGSMLMMSGALILISSSNISWNDILMFASTVVLMAGVSVLLGMTGPLALIGAGAMILLSVAMLASGFTLMLISNLKIDFGAIMKMMSTMLIISLMYAAMAITAIPAALGAALMLPVIIASLMMAMTMRMINNLTFENIGAFVGGLFAIATSFALITPLAIIGMVGALLLLPIVVTAGLLGVMLANISKLNITEDKMDSYAYGVKRIVEAMLPFNVVQLAKGAAKSLLMLPIATSALALALTLRAISKLDISEDKLDAFGSFTSKFIDVMVTAINAGGNKVKDIKKGLKGISKLTNVSSDLVDIVTAFSNMNYNQYDVVDGKLTLVGVRKITDKEIAMVGVNFGKLVAGLLSPLSIISSNDSKWDFGNGVVVDNPFGRGKSNKGIDRLSNIAGAFKPLSEAIAGFTNSSVILEEGSMINFKTNIGMFIDAIGYVFKTTDSWGRKSAKNTINSVAEFIEGFDDIDDSSFVTTTNVLNDFLDKMADENKWIQINRNLKTLASSFKEISTNVNMLDLDKALALEKNLKILSEKKSSNNLKEVVGLIEQLIDTIKGNDKPGATTTGVASNVNIPSKITAEIGDDVKAIFTEISEKLDTVNMKLGNKLKVAVVGNNSNSL